MPAGLQALAALVHTLRPTRPTPSIAALEGLLVGIAAMPGPINPLAWAERVLRGVHASASGASDGHESRGNPVDATTSAPTTAHDPDVQALAIHQKLAGGLLAKGLVDGAHQAGELAAMLLQQAAAIEQSLAGSAFLPQPIALDHPASGTLQDWCNGFLDGAMLDGTAWERLTQLDPALITPIAYFAEPEAFSDLRVPAADVQRLAAAIGKTVQLIARETRAEGSSIPAQMPVRKTPQAGRNDPCPCGSGKKFKKCCGQ